MTVKFSEIFNCIAGLRCIFLLLFILPLHRIAAQRPVISIDNHNVLYRGIENPVRIACQGYKSDQLLLSISGEKNKVNHQSENLYSVIVGEDTGVCFLYVTGVRKNKKQLLGTFRYQIKDIPKGNAKFGKLDNGNYSIDELLSQNRIEYSTDVSITGISENAAIVSYSVLILPKKGLMEEMNYNGNAIQQQLKDKISLLKIGDILVIQRIQMQMTGNKIALKPLLFIVVKPGWDKQQSTHCRISGNLVIDNEIRPYRYPLTEHSLNVSEKQQKHGIWKVWIYNANKQDYLINSVDSFHFGKRIYSEYFTDEKRDFRIDFISDSDIVYTSYHSNGRVYQTGNVKIESEEIRYIKSAFYEEPDITLNRGGFEVHLSRVSAPYFPVGQWLVYDSTGFLQLRIEYGLIIDSLVHETRDPDMPLFYPVQYYLVVPDGECIHFNQDGSIREKIIYRNGRVVRRK